MDLLVVADDAVPPAWLVARARRLSHVVPGEPRLTLIADLEQALLSLA